MKHDVEDIYRLTPVQQGMLFEALVAPENGAYFDQFVLRFEAGLDIGLLEQAWRRIAARHPVLRTAFFWEEVEEPVQLVWRQTELPFERLDWRDLDPTAREEKLRAFLDQDRARGFVLDQAPLMRLAAIRWSGTGWRIVWSYHHLILDGWSTALVLREVTAAYEALARGAEPTLETRRPFRDYIAWLRQQDLGAAEACWRHALAGFAEPTTIGIDRSPGRTVAPGDRYTEAAAVLPEDLTASLQELARRQRLTLNTLVQGAFALTLARYSAERDVVFGNTTAGRPTTLPGAEGMIGCFVNTLPVRARIDPGQDLAGWLRDLQEAQLELRRFEHSPLSEIRRWTGLPGDRPLFSAILVFENYAAAASAGKGSGWEAHQRTHFPLTLAAWPGLRLELRAGFYTDRFEAAAVARLLRHLEGVLRASSAAAPGLTLGGLPALPESERHQLLAEWNDTRPEDAPAETVVELFQEQARQSPEAVAVLQDGGETTYRELDLRATRLARHLARLGVAPGALVGLCCERTPDLPATILGIWKAGGAYLPLDPAYPDTRLALLLEDALGQAEAPVVLADKPLRERVAGLAPARARVLSMGEALGSGEEPAGWASRAEPGAPAYVIYTSGTTGLPKGVVVEHRSLASTLAAARRAFGFSAADSMPCLAPFSFDIFLFELLSPLLAGGCTVLFGLRPTLDVGHLVGRLGEMTLLHAVPALMRQVVEAARESGPWPGLRMAFVGGDAVPPDLLADMAEVFPQAQIQVLYGPTEATIICCRQEAPAGWSGSPGATPLGRPLDNAAVLLLDRWGDPVPIGVPGEVCIAGAGAARGYLHRPELTAERFPEIRGRRVYRSGDLARQLPDGRLEFLGRTDHQVKVRGFRIEPGEIEAALIAQDGVREAVVMAREDAIGDRRLVAYVVGDVATDALRRSLCQRLPDYMVPAAFVMLATLPLTPNGKVDRKALPAPDLQSAGTCLAPRTPVEEILAGIWSELLGLERVGAADHFFDLGGHSLLATQVTSRLRSIFNVEMPLRDLFEAPVLADLAARVEAARRTGAGPLAPPLVPMPRQGPVPLSFAQQRLWFIDQLEPGSPAYNVPLALGLHGLLSVPALAASLAEVARRHEVLRTTFLAAEGRPFQVISASPRLELPLVDLAGLPQEVRQREAHSLLAAAAMRPFDLGRGPLARATLLRLAAEEHAALLNLHHIVSDGWSVGVLVREVSALYPAFLRGEPSPLPEPPVQYADYAIWQRGWLQGEALDAQLAWWRQELAGAPALLELPTDRPRPPVPSYRGAVELITFGPPLAQALADLARREGATLFMGLLAGFQALLHRYSGDGDLLVGTPIASRNHAELESLIGFFANTLVLRARLSPGLVFREALARARTTALGAYAHRELPFERLVDDLGTERSLAHGPLFQVMLALQNAPLRTLELPDLTLSPVAVAAEVSKFDLTLSVTETDAGLATALEHAADLFDRPTARRLLEHLRTLLEGAAARPDLPLANLPLLGPAELEELRAWSQGGPAATAVPTAPELFAAHAARDPAAPALLHGEERISYGELARRAGRLARHLRALGIGPEDLAALCCERSPRLVEAMLGTLLAGGAYLPLDPDYPPERLRLLLADSGARFLLTTSALSDRLSTLAGSAVRIVHLDRELADGSFQAHPPALPPLQPGQLAYVIYTSGSTGRPKGVLVQHDGIPNLAAAQGRAFGVGPGDRILQFSSPSFDASVSEIWMALAAGAALVLAPREELLPGPGLQALLRRQGVTHATLPPPALAAMPAGAPEQLPALRTLIVAGEPCPVPLARLWSPGRRFFNAYGPTEATVCASLYEATGREGERVPIGRPLAGLRVHVLGPALAPVPAGVPGELLLGGIALARGYLARPATTAERFIPDPFGAGPGDRLYRTGDLVRWRPDGALELIGRVDDQVKVRGFRIEPGEIEATLALHPAVREAVAGVRNYHRGDGILIAWIAAGAASHPPAAELRAFLRERLPDFMVPAAFVFLDALPLSPNGKVDRRALPPPDEAARERPPHAAPGSEIERRIAAAWQEVLGVERVGLHDNFFDLGGHSLRLVEVHARLLRSLGRDIPVVTLFQYPTVAGLAAHLAGEEQMAGVRSAPPGDRGDSRPALAVIGLSGSFPGAADLDQLWDNLRRGVESARRLTDGELLAAGIRPELLASDRYVKVACEIEGVDLFDAEFFGLSPREAEVLDPQQRLFLEHAWQALEHAGYDSRRPSGPVGVYAGAQMSTYLFNLLSRPDIMEALGPFTLQPSVDKDYVATRTSYALDLKGPSVAVQTACSTSLVAIHFACQALANRECDMALAGGVAVRVPQGTGYLYQDAGVLSPDGHCRAFDAAARGAVPGSGVGVVVLKRLDDALRDGDTIHAVVRGTAINNDGALKVGFTAPGVEGQAQVIASAQAAAGVHPDSVGCVETHGTGTQLGDPIEVAALTRAFRAGGSQRTGFCALGSIKTNIGHLDTAAGIAGFLKATLALKHRQIPPSLNFEQPNPAIDFSASPFYVNTRLADWPAGDAPRRAGVSSFGIGGTNAHAVLEEAPEPRPGGPSRPFQLLLLSARTPAALEEATGRLAEHLARHPGTSLADACYTLQIGRRPFPCRRALVCSAPEEAAAALGERDPQRLVTRRAAERRPVAFLFPGQGAQHPGMGRGLYESEPAFRRALDECAERLAPRLGCDLRALLYPAAGEPAAAAERRLRQTRYAQPALFAVEHALARLWLSWGVEPAALIGHSLGEYTAACLAGVLSLEDALDLIAARGELMQELPPGAMLAVDLPEAEIERELAGGLALAAVNGLGLCAVAGPEEEIADLERRLEARGAVARRLHTSHAFHSAMMEPVLRPFAELVSRVTLRAPAIPYLSNLTGTWITAGQATNPAYWVRHLRETVRFGPGLQQLLAEASEGLTLLEVGPGRTLGELARRQIPPGSGHDVVASLRHPREEGADPAVLLRALGRLWLAGAAVDWQAFWAGEERRRIPLPTYPFQRRRYWIERRALQAVPAAQETAEAPAPAQATVETAAGHARPDLDKTYVAPRNAVERRLVAVWQALLGIAEIGVHDDFFELGGHSLLATRVISQVRETFGCELDLESFFAAPTVAGLAARIGERHEDGSSPPPIVRVPRSAPLPLSFAQQRLLFLERLAPGDVSYHLPVVLRLSGELDRQALRTALERLVERHEVLRTVFAVDESEQLQVIAPAEGRFQGDLPLIDLGALPASRTEAESRRVALEAARLPLDLYRGPILRACLLRLAPTESDLLLNIHHIAADGWSYSIVFGEMLEFYEALVEGHEARLPELPVQYADYAAWQRGWLEGEVLSRQIDYWRQRLAGLPLLELPTDRPRPRVRTGHGAVERTWIRSEIIEPLRSTLREEEATLFMALLAAFSVLLRHASGSDDLVIGTDIANRTQSATERLIGLFVNQLALRIDVSGEPTFRELLRRVRRLTLDAYAHQDAPFDKVVEALKPARDLSRTPLFQAKLVLQNTPAAARRARNLTVTPLDLDTRTAKFDLLLNLTESGSGLDVRLEYSTDLFTAPTAVSLLDGFVAVVCAAAARPDAGVGELAAELRGLDPAARRMRARQRQSQVVRRAQRRLVPVPQS